MPHRGSEAIQDIPSGISAGAFRANIDQLFANDVITSAQRRHARPDLSFQQEPAQEKTPPTDPAPPGTVGAGAGSVPNNIDMSGQESQIPQGGFDGGVLVLVAAVAAVVWMVVS